MKAYDYVKKYLPTPVVKSLDNLSSLQQQGITEIRIRRNTPVVLIVQDKTLFVDELCQCVSVLPAFALKVGDKEFDDMLNQLFSYSFYSNIVNLKNGYITLENGSRVGVCSTAVYENDELTSVKDISSVNIRIPRQAVGCSKEVMSKLFADGVCSTIIAGKPSSGKTTLLRDIARELSNGFNGEYKKLVLVDERNEFAGKINNAFTLDVGINTDVITGFEKAKGIENAIRTMSPDVVVCDEISTADELNRIKLGFSCGVSFLLSVHIGKKYDLYAKPIINMLLSTGEFKKIVLLGENYSARIYDAMEIKNEINRRSANNTVISDDWNIYDK